MSPPFNIDSTNNAQNTTRSEYTFVSDTPPLYEKDSSHGQTAAAVTPRSNPTALSSWFKRKTSRQHREINLTIQTILRDIVRPTTDTAAAVGIIQSCADTCSSYSLSFPALLNSAFFEQHTLFYWVIVNRKGDEIFDSLFLHAQYLSTFTKSDIRRACFIISDQAMLQRLQPCINPPEEADSMLLFGYPRDTVQILSDDGSHTFAVTFHIQIFQRRIRANRILRFEFMAKGTIWQVFFVQDYGREYPGRWNVVLRLLGDNQSTYPDADFIVEMPDYRVPKVSLRLERKDYVSQVNFVACLDPRIQDEGSPYMAIDGSFLARLNLSAPFIYPKADT